MKIGFDKLIPLKIGLLFADPNNYLFFFIEIIFLIFLNLEYLILPLPLNLLFAYYSLVRQLSINRHKIINYSIRKGLLFIKTI